MKVIPLALGLLLCTGCASAADGDKYQATIDLFRNAGASRSYFDNAYGYAVFPTIGKAGIVMVGGARGSGRVFVNGQAVGETTMTQIGVGPQLGGQSYSQMIFFEDQRAFDDFSSGNFEFGAAAGAVAITAGASAAATTTGSSAGMSGGKKDATTAGRGYYKGMAVFSIVKAGLMVEIGLAGQKFSYKPL